MKRAEKVKRTASDIIETGQKPSARLLRQKLDYAEPDIHRCLNFLEKRGDVETYTKKVFGTEHRMVSVKRN